MTGPKTGGRSAQVAQIPKLEPSCFPNRECPAPRRLLLDFERNHLTTKVRRRRRGHIGFSPTYLLILVATACELSGAGPLGAVDVSMHSAGRRTRLCTLSVPKEVSRE